MSKTPFEIKIALEEKFPYVDFQLRNVTPEVVESILETLKEKYLIYERRSIFDSIELLEGAFIFSEPGKLLAVIYIDYEPSSFHDNTIMLTVMYAPIKEGRSLIEVLKKELKEYLLPRFHVVLKILNQWNDFKVYSLASDELTMQLIPELFYGIDVHKLAESFLKSSQNILILLGSPGTGKSKLIQFILGQSPSVLSKPVNVLMIKGERNIKNSANSISIYLENDIVVLDDLDLITLKRGEDNEISDVVSTILSTTDGFLPKRPKIIISTNRTFKEIDPALLRPSRLFDILELQDIPKEYFLKVCKKYPNLRIALPLFKEKTQVKVSEIFDFITRKTLHKDYLTDKNISKRENNFLLKLGFK